MRLRRWGKLGLKLVALMAAGAVVAVIAFFVLGLAYPFQQDRLAEADRPGSALILDRNGTPVAWRVGAKESWRLPTGIDDISPWLIKATVAAEDKRFFSHRGIDPVAVARALIQNAGSRRRISGASTITMQAVRLMWPRDRTYRAKATESFRALQLERIMAKRDVVELYLNLAPYGGNVVGAEAAARRYFGKSARELTLGEASLLAGIPQSPARFNPRKHLDAALMRREYVLARMLSLGYAQPGDLEMARREPIAISQSVTRSGQERFASLVVGRLGLDCGTVKTTLDPEITSICKAAVDARADELRARGIDGLAVVVIDIKRSELAAMIGSSDPSDPLVGQVNGATSLRQPGSLLKPFIYGRAFDLGLLTPDSIVYDVPTQWRGYSPENFDRRFAGPMSAARALRESRNVPAVRLLGRIGVERLAGDIAQLGLPVRAAEDRCGLSLALGSAEVRLIDVATAYAAIARLGEWRPLRLLANGPAREPRRIYSRGAAYMTLRCLGAQKPGGTPRPAWKTGTSWEHRDAWAVAMTPKYVVAVWCGDIAGSSHPELVGARTALPIAYELANTLESGGTWAPPSTIRIHRACALSGAPASTYCPDAVEAEHMPGLSLQAPCRLHRRRHRGDNDPGNIAWPPEVASWLASRSPQEPHATSERGNVHILSPASGADYLTTDLSTESGELDLVAHAPPGAAGTHWFLDGELLGYARAGQALQWQMIAGVHEVLAVSGSSHAKARFTVRNVTVSRRR